MNTLDRMTTRTMLIRLLLIAAGLQLVLTVGIYVAARQKISPSIDQNGCTVAISPDCILIVSRVGSLAEVLKSNGPLAWFKTREQIFIRIYSLPAAILGSWLGVNILTVEPANLLFYVAILTLTFQIGALVFDRRVGLVAAAVVALWPSFLVHTTQVLKDPLFIATFLSLILITTIWLTKALSLLNGLVTAVVGVTSIFTISLTRSGFWGAIMIALLVVGLGLMLIRQLLNKRFLPVNIASAVLVVLVSGLINHYAPEQFEAIQPEAAPGATASAPVQDSSQRVNRLATRLSMLRQGWLYLNKDAGSNIDTQVEFQRPMDVVRYLPRAWAVGFLAPFPNFWLTRGKQVGLAGRLFSGFEMLLTYIAELLALFGLWRARANLSAWFLASSIFMGISALALAVVNLGTLYRFRYAFLILLLVLAVKGLMGLIAYFKPEITIETKEASAS